MTYMEDHTITTTTTTTDDAANWAVSYGSTPVATVEVPTPVPAPTKVKHADGAVTFPQGKAIYWLTGYGVPKDAECRVVEGKGYRLIASRIISAAKRGDLAEAHRLLPSLPGVNRTGRADRINNNKPAPRVAKPKAMVAKPKPAKKPAPPARVERLDVTDPFGDIEL